MLWLEKKNIIGDIRLLNDKAKPEKIKIYHLQNSSRQEIDFDYFDLDEDGSIDYVEWNVEHLSEQIYEIIYITKAVHLDSDRGFISDIYDYVKEKDGNWSEVVNEGEYVRLTFEQ